jgi:hypothetical protein
MPFLRRLGLYLLGLSVGLVFLAIFLKRKTDETGTYFCYLPNCRVLKELRSKPFEYSEGIKDLMAAGTLDSTDIAGYLNNGDVDFGKSDTEAQPCRIYFIEGRIHEQPALLKVKSCQDKVLIDALE